MLYAGARFYMPNLGRWTSVDPQAARAPGWSTYNYVFNNPLRYVDPDGEFPWGAVIGAAVDVGVQTMVENRSFREISWKRVAVSAGAGALSGGLSSLHRAGQVGRTALVTGEVAIQAAGSAGTQLLEEGDISLSGIAVDVAVGQLGNRTVGDFVDSRNAPSRQQMQNSADRRIRAARNSGSRRTERVERRQKQGRQDRQRANDDGAVSSTTAAGAATGVARGALSENEERDN